MKSGNTGETVSNGPRTQSTGDCNLTKVSADLLETSEGTSVDGSPEGDGKGLLSEDAAEHSGKNRTDPKVKDKKIVEEVPPDAVSRETGPEKQNKDDGTSVDGSPVGDGKGLLSDDAAERSDKNGIDPKIKDKKIVEEAPPDAVSRETRHEKQDKDDVEVSEILQATESRSELESDEMETEFIMTKTFTESIKPDKEFVPVRSDYLQDGTEQCWSATVSAAVATPSAKRSDISTDGAAPKSATSDESSATAIPSRAAVDEQTTNREIGTSEQNAEDDFESRSAVRMARGQMRDLTSEFRHLQELLDNLSAPTHPANPGSSSDEDVMGDGGEGQPPSARVVYSYRLRTRPTSAEQQLPRRRWRHRSSDDTEQSQDAVAKQSRTHEDLKQQEACVVEAEQHLSANTGEEQQRAGELAVSSES